jgi:hypothetical protein
MLKFLIDKSPATLETRKDNKYVLGQLVTPLTGYRNWGGVYAMDNGAFSSFRADKFKKLLVRDAPVKKNCLFVTVPDVVGSGRRTLEIWRHRHKFCAGWPMALVAQDGIEDLDIPWDEMFAIFIGGKDPWKDSDATADIVRTAKILGIHVHIGRINTAKRYLHFDKLGADTCDGSGIAMYDHMLEKLAVDVEKANSEIDLFN